MAKRFYSMDEVCNALGKNAEEVKGLVRDGSLREFRDAGKVFFNSDDVEKLRAAKGSASADSGEITLEPVDDELPSIAPAPTPSRGGTSIIGLEPLDDEPEPAKPAPRPLAVPAARAKEDSGVVARIDDELDIDADPMAKTQITSGAVGDQMTLEGSGSGSGLLDLTRESDDTSLGAELLDEIYPGEEEGQKPAKKRAAAVAAPAEAADETEAEAAAPEPVYAGPSIAVGDPSEGLFAGLMVGTLIVLAVSGSVGAAVLQNFVPDYARYLSNNLLIFLGAALGIPLLAMLLGWVMGRGSGPARPRPAKAARPAKGRPGKPAKA